MSKQVRGARQSPLGPGMLERAAWPLSIDPLRVQPSPHSIVDAMGASVSKPERGGRPCKVVAGLLQPQAPRRGLERQEEGGGASEKSPKFHLWVSSRRAQGRRIEVTAHARTHARTRARARAPTGLSAVESPTSNFSDSGGTPGRAALLAAAVFEKLVGVPEHDMPGLVNSPPSH